MPCDHVCPKCHQVIERVVYVTLYAPVPYTVTPGPTVTEWPVRLENGGQISKPAWSMTSTGDVWGHS
jgi:hypothetical protein